MYPSLFVLKGVTLYALAAHLCRLVDVGPAADDAAAAAKFRAFWGPVSELRRFQVGQTPTMGRKRAPVASLLTIAGAGSQHLYHLADLHTSVFALSCRMVASVRQLCGGQGQGQGIPSWTGEPWEGRG
jgi:hypothetical protein